MLRPTALLLAALVSATACAPLSAQPLVDVDIVDRDTGEWLPEYRHRGRDWVPGTPGHRYGVRLTNTTGERVLVVLSVDGVNAISGETAAANQTGYVLGPWQSTEITGWRKSWQDVAQFYFTDLPDSYAARTGRPDNVGVIGVAVFRERAQPQPYYAPPVARDNEYDDRYRGRNESKSAPAAAPQASRRAAEAADSASGVGQSIGTGHGQREWAPVSRTDFVRASRTPAQVVQVRYDDIPNLVAMGVMPRPYRYDDGYRRGQPQAFPNGFAADPPGRW
ncbi:hypothetical protein [Lysobacter hankyongensis]|uniref:Secreted protein n=1 Tax=Lysobacter hankyongensis TaxID=1176535 RepID=A0ABP9AXN9_9GAMM